MKAKRRYLTKNERADMAHAQGGLCACGCDNPLGERFVAEHWVCVALGNDEKPDSLLRIECAARKTVRGVKAIAKVKRIRKNLDPKRVKRRCTIASRGFEQKYKKKINGEVVRRDVQKLRRASGGLGRQTGAAQ